MDFAKLNADMGLAPKGEVVEEMWADPPMERDPFDPAPLKALFDLYQTKIDEITVMVDELVVDSPESAEKANDMAAQAKIMAKAVNTKRTELKDPYWQQCKAIDGFAQPIVKALQALAKTAEGKQTPYLLELRRQEREAAAAAEAEANRLQAEQEAAHQKAVEEAKKNDAPEPAAPAPIVPTMPVESTVKSTAGKTVLKEETVWEITDPVALVKAYYESLKAPGLENFRKAFAPVVNAMIKIGAPVIPGVTVTTVQTAQTRAAK